MLIKNILRALFVTFVALSTLQVATLSSKAETISISGFTGELTTTLTSGIAIRTENNDCRLIGGAKVGLKTTDTDAIRGNFQDYVGYTADNGNGGCNVYEQDSYGNMSNKAYERVNANSDDGKLNFKKHDVVDAGQSLALSFSGRHQSGASLNLSAVAMLNPALDMNAPKFKAMTGEAEDNFESVYKLGNAYITAPVSDTVDITIGNYVQSQGTTALFPIGVNVVNPVSLPLLRSPGAQLKDALLPQAMIGLTAFANDVTVDAYYQLDQKEVELDSSGSFFGSDFVGVGEDSGLISSPNYRESRSVPFAGNYHDISTCLSDQNGAQSAGCTDEGLWAGINADGTGTRTDDGNKAGYDLWTSLTATSGAGLTATMGGFNAANNPGVSGVADATDYSSLFTSGLGAAGGAVLGAAPGVAGAGASLTDAQILGAMNTLIGAYKGIGSERGLVNIHQAPDAKADDSGQYGINISGYMPDVGSGVEWGLYFNNSHSNSPRIRYLAIADGYATDMYGLMNILDGSRDFTDPLVTDWEQHMGSVAYGSLICGVVIATTEYGGYAGTTASAAGTKWKHDPETCYAAFDSLGDLAWLAESLGGNPNNTAYGSAAAARAAVHAGGTGATVAALATLAYANGARYQQYYPEDIKTYGGSISTGIGDIAANFEVAYRPDYPFQLDISQMTNMLLDSTGGTAVQSLVAFSSAANQGDIQSFVGTHKWSSIPNCDISSATGTASAELSGYVVCDGTAEHDVWTFNTNLAKSFRASDPLVVALGADNAAGLLDIGLVYVPGLDANQGLLQSGNDTSGHDVYGSGCQDASLTNSTSLSAHKNGLFGNNYCENDSGPDDVAISYKVRASATYNNFNNSAWSFTPNVGWNHDAHGDAPSSLGGFVEGRMSANFGATFAMNQLSANINYSAQLGDYDDNKSSDMDYVSATLQYAF